MSAVSHFFWCNILTQSVDRALLMKFINYWPFRDILRKSINKIPLHEGPVKCDIGPQDRES